MAETLGSLCDKLTIVKLKQFHAGDPVRLESLEKQQNQLQEEIDAYVFSGLRGEIPLARLTFSANKIFKEEGNAVSDISGSIGNAFATLAEVNCKLWHEQEKVYDFEKVPVSQKDSVVKSLAVLNLRRNKCIDHIDKEFRSVVSNLNPQHT